MLDDLNDAPPDKHGRYLHWKLNKLVGQRVYVLLRQTTDGLAAWQEKLIYVGEDYIVLDIESGKRASPADPYIHVEHIIPMDNIARINAVTPLEERINEKRVVRV